MDTLLSTQITNLSSDVRSGFERVERQVGDLVTKGEFNATVARLDTKDTQLEQAIRDTDRKASDSIAAGFKARSDEEEKRTTKTRWMIGTVLVVIGLLSPWLKDIVLQAVLTP